MSAERLVRFLINLPPANDDDDGQEEEEKEDDGGDSWLVVDGMALTRYLFLTMGARCRSLTDFAASFVAYAFSENGSRLHHVVVAFDDPAHLDLPPPWPSAATELPLHVSAWPLTADLPPDLWALAIAEPARAWNTLGVQWRLRRAVSAALVAHLAAAKQWARIVQALWMPGEDAYRRLCAEAMAELERTGAADTPNASALREALVAHRLGNQVVNVSVDATGKVGFKRRARRQCPSYLAALSKCRAMPQRTRVSFLAHDTPEALLCVLLARHLFIKTMDMTLIVRHDCVVGVERVRRRLRALLTRKLRIGPSPDERTRLWAAERGFLLLVLAQTVLPACEPPPARECTGALFAAAIAVFGVAAGAAERTTRYSQRLRPLAFTTLLGSQTPDVDVETLAAMLEWFAFQGAEQVALDRARAAGLAHTWAARLRERRRYAVFPFTAPTVPAGEPPPSTGEACMARATRTQWWLGNAYSALLHQGEWPLPTSSEFTPVERTTMCPSERARRRELEQSGDLPVAHWGWTWRPVADAAALMSPLTRLDRGRFGSGRQLVGIDFVLAPYDERRDAATRRWKCLVRLYEEAAAVTATH